MTRAPPGSPDALAAQGRMSQISMQMMMLQQQSMGPLPMGGGSAAKPASGGVTAKDGVKLATAALNFGAALG
jgi:hypothetical protein